ncbi:MAG TPA: hypothetical protein VF173_05375 [Thermoanaerobaculia bacterium]|nr:hypothetical protein [Thermoanaerobaculia bacterium]
MSIEEVLLKSGLAAFLEATGLQPESPDEYRVTVPDGYQRLLEHIRVHGYCLGIEQGRDVPWHQEVASWRVHVYKPIAGMIRRSDILKEFPERTETGLYLFLMDHLHSLRERYHNPAMPPEEAMKDFEQMKAPRPPGRLRGWLTGKIRGEAGKAEKSPP